MKKNSIKIGFGRVFWPSFLALVLVLGGIGLCIMLLLGSLMDTPQYSVPQNTVLHLNLNGRVVENSSKKFNTLEFEVEHNIGLSDMLYAIDYAKKDDKIKGIYIELGSFSCGLASAQEIRAALEDFQNSGKFLVSYFNGELVGQTEYYIASVAKEKYGFHSTMMEFGGMGMELMYFKGMLDKLGLEMQVIRGHNNDFKSAVEPYFLSEMSDSARLQNEVLLNNCWTNYKNTISSTIGVSPEELDMIADSVKIKRLDDAFKYGLVDSILYKDEVMQKIANKIGVDESKDVELKNFAEYARNKFYDNQKLMRSKKANVAVIVAEGEIVTKGGQLSSEKYVKLIREAREDKHIKTIVFRVNSPGGSALASDEIWREVVLANKEKSVIVSMGDLAASGGYYISSPAKRIFASENTITGSIGVFGVIPFTGDALSDNFGLSFDRVSTNAHSVFSLNKRLTDYEMTSIQNEVDLIYKEFLERVSEGRGMTVDQVNNIARGRVWTGSDAVKIGLVDEIGGLDDAIAYAIDDAGIEDAKIEYFPTRKKEAFEEILESISKENEVKVNTVSQEFLKHYQRLKSLESKMGIQARIPDFNIQ